MKGKGKRWIVSVAAVVVLLGGYLTAAHVSGGALHTLGLPLGGVQGEMRRNVMRFWEDIQFKDFDSAAQYHSPEARKTVDIPYLIERMFGVKPEGLDVKEYEVMWVDLDSSKRRARVRTRVKGQVLTDGKIRTREVMLYFTSEKEGAPWYMNFETSLRAPETDANKKH